jgi:hypothetical protein
MKKKDTWMIFHMDWDGIEKLFLSRREKRRIKKRDRKMVRDTQKMIRE